jgi:hypothetical protein
MKVKGIISEDFTNYKKPSLFIAMPTCTFKCEKDCGKKMCQNSQLVNEPTIEVDTRDLIKRFNPSLVEAVVFGGLEPFDSFRDLFEFIRIFRDEKQNDIVIYTGYTEKECKEAGWLDALKNYDNIIIKFGRFVPGENPHKDEILGVSLASDNQYAKKI